MGVLLPGREGRNHGVASWELRMENTHTHTHTHTYIYISLRDLAFTRGSNSEAAADSSLDLTDGDQVWTSGRLNITS